jgi:hypothetical protein
VGRRAGSDPDALAALGTVSKKIEAITSDAVTALRDQLSDPEIADALGCTRQNVGQRFGRRSQIARTQPASETLGQVPADQGSPVQCEPGFTETAA